MLVAVAVAVAVAGGGGAWRLDAANERRMARRRTGAELTLIKLREQHIAASDEEGEGEGARRNRDKQDRFHSSPGIILGSRRFLYRRPVTL